MVTVALMAGLGLAGALAARAGWGAVAEIVLRLSAAGLALVCALQAVAVVLCALGWRALLPGGSLGALVAARAIRDGTSSTLAILPGVGEIAGIRALTVMGVPVAPAAASGVVDLAAELLSQCLFTLLGVAALLALPGALDGSRTALLAIGAALPAAALVGLFGSDAGQRLLGRLIAWSARMSAPVAGSLGGAVAFELAARSADRGAIAASTLLHLVAWLFGAAQVWAGAAALGHPVGALAALGMASVVHAVRGIFFVVPWGAGVQEAGFVVAGALVGMDEATALALSLVTRARDLILGLPALAIWAAIEARLAARAVGLRGE